MEESLTEPVEATHPRVVIRQMYRSIGDSLDRGDYEYVDFLFQNLNEKKIHAQYLLGFLTITLGWRKRLPHRAHFYAKIEKQLHTRYPEEKVKKLLEGLE